MNNLIKTEEYYCIIGSKNILSSIQSIFLSKCYIENNKLFLLALNIQPFSRWCFAKEFSFDHLKLLIKSLITQLNFLKENGKMIIGFNIDELYVADNYHFFIVPSLPLGNIIDSQIKIIYPFAKPQISCPELLKISSLPVLLPVNAFDYMLGQFAIYAYFKINILRGNDVISSTKLEEILLPIKNSKEYSCILKSIDRESDRRELLFIE